MIVVDSSVWIDNLLGEQTEPVRKLRLIRSPREIIVGDVILLEVLQGARDEEHSARIERDLRQFTIAPMLDDHLAVRAAANYRELRRRGLTVRKTVDVIVATFCLEHGHALLHDDRDFDPFVKHLGLRVI
jgi:predicted nucleic acid-binding protein